MVDISGQTSDTREHKPKVSRMYTHDASNTPVPRAGLDVNAVIFKVVESGETITFDLATAFGGELPPPCVGRAAAAFGINTSAGNAANTAGSDNPTDIAEAIEGRLESFTNGRWSAERSGGGPRTTVLIEALTIYRKAHGADVSDKRMAEFRDMFDTDKEAVKRWMADPAFRATFEKHRADKQAQKAAAAAAEARGKPRVDSGLLD